MSRSIFALVLVLAFATLGLAQTNTGRLTGTVSSADGVIPGATVVLADTKTGKERTTVTNGEGNYTFQLLDYGQYTLKVTATGFKTTTSSVTINVAQEYSFSPTLEVGQVSETVTVTGGVEAINSSNAELSSTVTNRQIVELPLANRNPLALILTQPGAASNPNQGTSINGGRTSSANITRDGVNIQDNYIRSNATDFAAGRPSVDNVEEFTLTSQSSVDTGFGSAQITFVTPRGSNGYHGSLWEYNRNSKFGANSWFNDAAGVKNPFRNRNQYGFKVAGPILKNKLFFFVYGEKLHDIVTASKLVTVLTPTAAQGTFRYAVTDPNTKVTTIYSANIFTPGAFNVGPSGNAVPTALNNAVQSRILALMPAGNSSEVGDGLNTMGYRFAQHNDTVRNGFTSRVDYDLNAKNNINAVIDYSNEGNLRGDIDTVNIIPVVNQPAKNVTYSGGWRWSPTAALSNEFRIGRFYSAPVFLVGFSRPEWTTVPLVTNVDPLNGAAIFRNQGRYVKTSNVQDTVSWGVGNHSIRMGAQYEGVHVRVFNDGGNQPTYTLGISANGPTLQQAVLAASAGGPSLSTTQQTTARNLFALLGGVISAGQQTFNPTSPTSGFVNGATQLSLYKYSLFAPYVADQWKIRRDLTLDLGIRWDYQTPLKSENQLFFEPIIGSQGAVAAALDPTGSYQIVGGNAGHAGWFYKADKNNWAPSFGVAWAPKFEKGFLHTLTGDDFVIRGGYRRSFVNDELVKAPSNADAGNAGLGATAVAALACFTAGCTPSSSNLDDRLGAAHQSVLGAPGFLANRTYATNNGAAFNNTGTVFAVDPNLQTPDQNDFSIGVQRRFGKWVAEARYVGGFSHNMLRTIDYNQIKIPGQYVTDFNTVRANVLAGCPAGNGGTAGSARACANGTVLFNQMPDFGGVTPTNNQGVRVTLGYAGEVIWQQLIAGSIPNPNTTPVPAGALRSLFLANPNTGVANVLGNGGRYNYNAGQFEVRRQFSGGFNFQANYTFSKELTDAIGTGQTRVEPFLDNAHPELDYTRADYDQTHAFNVNAIYELPFGKGKRWLNENGFMDRIVGGWQVGLIWRVGSGSPMTITDAVGTLNRAGRSARQTAVTTLTKAQLKKAIGVFRTPCGLYWIDPKYINVNQTNLAAGNCSAAALTSVPAGTFAGGGASGYGQPTFAGQVFFNNAPFTTSSTARAIVNGPWYSSADLSIIKNIRISERINFQVRGEMYNFTNSPYFTPVQFGTSADINSSNFGKLTNSAVGSRVVQFAGRLSF